MKYYVIPLETLRIHGMGNEPWRKKKLGNALVSEAEVTGGLGYESAKEFEQKVHVTPISLNEALDWSRNI